ncbi:MAG: membrane protein insertion efficiency factor YidD [Betaproteobacteria bacterium]
MAVGEKISNVLGIIVVGAIRLYQRSVSPLLPRHCRYYPTCSQYAAEAIGRHGIWRGGYLSVRRLLRCHPGCPGGYDPVPEATGRAKEDAPWGC